MKLTEKFGLLTTAVIGVLYILLRFWHLTDSCLWFDELFGVHAAGMNWSEMFGFIARDLIHPPLFYALLKIWILNGGDSLFWLRFFPVLFSILALVPFYFLCRQLKLSWLSVMVALGFLACNGALIKYAQEVRMYSLLMFFSLFSMWFFTRFLHLGKNIWLLTVCNVLMIYTHYFGWLVVLAEVLAILFIQRIKIRQILIMFGICLVCFTPWILAVFRASQVNADLSQNIGWISKPDFYALFQFVFDLIEPFYFQTSSSVLEPPSIYLISVPLLVIIAAAKIIYLTNYKNLDEAEKRDFLMLAIFIAAPLVIALSASWILPYSVWGTRHLIIIFAPTAIAVGLFFDKLKPEILKSVFLSITVLLFVTAFVFEINRPKGQFIWCAWENLSGNINENLPAKIYVFEDLVAYHFWFAERKNPNAEIVKIENLDGVLEDKSYFLPRGFDGVKKINFDGINEPQFYIAFREQSFDPQKPPLKNLLEKGFTIGEPKIYEAQGLKAFLIKVRKEK